MDAKFGMIGLLVLAFVLRVWVAWVGDFLLHPDEVFQYLEQGHRVVFGYGIVPWEYRYGTRSWLLAGSIAVLLWPLKALGWDRPDIYLFWIKFVFCVFSMSIPVGMMMFARRYGGEKAACWALLLGGFWYELVVFAHKPLPGMVATGWLFLALGIGWDEKSVKRAWGVGLCLGSCLGLRVQLAPLVLGVAVFAMASASWRVRLHLCAASSVVLLGVGALDAVTWGGWWHSYLAGVQFNVAHGVASGFGVEPYWYFLWGLGVASLGMIGVVLLLVLVLRPVWGWVVLMGVLLVVVPHSLIAHKEYRFVFTAIPLWLLLGAFCLGVSARWVRGVVGVGLGVVAILGILNRLPSQDQLYDARQWDLLRAKGRITYLPFRFLERRADLVMAKEIFFRQDIKAVWMAVNSLAFSGGYTFLHRPIPMYGVRLPDWLGVEELDRHVTHIVWREGASPYFRTYLEHRGFVEEKRIGEIVLFAKKSKGAVYVWCHHTKHIAHPPVDFRFRPLRWPLPTEIAEKKQHCVGHQGSDDVKYRWLERSCRLRKDRRPPLH
ncbi:hypothetical protein L6R29_05030 [Myxococcota bacterium]|nr:hypothetical protein [Myxococcota bacterium]